MHARNLHRVLMRPAFNTDINTRVATKKHNARIFGKWNKSHFNRQTTLLSLDQYMCSNLGLWNSQDWWAAEVYMYVQGMRPLKQSGPLGNPSSHGYYVFTLVVVVDLEGQGRSPLKQWASYLIFLHLWSKFGDPSLNGSWVIADWRTHPYRRSKWQCQAKTELG